MMLKGLPGQWNGLPDEPDVSALPRHTRIKLTSLNAIDVPY